MSFPESDISVVVCCYNSSSRLPETIQHLAQQNIQSGFNWEIINIDNASTDNTKLVAQQELNKTTNIDYRIIDELEKGLARARERGVKEAKFGIIIFCDDDNHLQPDYLEKARSLMASRPEVGILGGLVKPKLAYYPGKWIEAMYTAMGIGARGSEDGYTDWVFGAGMAIRKKIFTDLKERNIEFILSDRVGSKQTAGGDSELCELAKFIGYKIYYSSSLVLYHYMQAYRLKKSFFFKGHSTIYSLIYLWILGALLKIKSKQNYDNLYKTLLWQKTRDIFYYLPRIFIGKYRFYSFLSFYQSILTVGWLVLRKNKFDRLYHAVVINLGI